MAGKGGAAWLPSGSTAPFIQAATSSLMRWPGVEGAGTGGARVREGGKGRHGRYGRGAGHKHGQVPCPASVNQRQHPVPCTAPPASQPHLQPILEVVRQQAAVRKHNVVHHQHGGVLGQLAGHGAPGLVQVPPRLQRGVVRRSGCASVGRLAAPELALPQTASGRWRVRNRRTAPCQGWAAQAAAGRGHVPAGCDAGRPPRCRPRSAPPRAPTRRMLQG